MEASSRTGLTMRPTRMIYIGHHRRSFGDPVYWVGEGWTRPAFDHSGFMPLTMVAVVRRTKGAALGCIGL